MKKTILVLVVSVLFFSCKPKKKEVAITENLIKLHVFSGGKIIVNNLELFSQDTTYQGQSKEFANPFYVIQHPKGILMWDAGLPENLVGLPKSFTDPSDAFTISRKDSLINQLKSIKLKVSDFKYIALSHSHIGHANSFKDAIWLVQKNEYKYVTSDSAQIKEATIYTGIKDLKNPKLLHKVYAWSYHWSSSFIFKYRFRKTNLINGRFIPF
ncbi:MAG: MBL fold metallo-hydrolase [Flavobacteriaceae bacterium]|nr:MBL fold metallo-hydrolase [Flavobacteriaceae bacterium]